ncbi:MAG: PAS domain-containing protein [Candidatus Brocadiales bacterium]
MAKEDTPFNKKPKHLSVRGRLLLFTLCISLIPITITTVIYYFNAKNMLKKQTVEWLTLIAASKKMHVLEFMEAKKGRTIDFGSDGFIRESLENINRRNLSTQRQDNVITLNKHLAINKKPLDSYLEAIAVLDIEGKVIASTDNKFVGKDLSDQVAFMQSIPEKHSNAHVDQPYYFPLLGTNVINISAPIISRSRNDTIGFIVNSYNLDALSDITMKRGGIGDSGEVYLVNRDGVLLTGCRFEDGPPIMTVVSPKLIHRGVEEEKTNDVYLGCKGLPVIGASAHISEYDWTLIAEIDKGEAFAPINMLGFLALLVGLVSAALVGGIGIVFAMSLSRPIKELVNTTEKFKHQNLKYRVKVARKDEIGELASHFNAMAEEREKSRKENDYTRRALKRSKESLTHVERVGRLGSWDWNVKKDKLHCSDEVYHILGLEPQQIVLTYEAFLNFVHPRDRESVEEATHGALYEGKPYSPHFRIVRPDGSERIVHAQGEVLFDETDKTQRMIGTFKDVTTTKQAGNN